MRSAMKNNSRMLSVIGSAATVAVALFAAQAMAQPVDLAPNSNAAPSVQVPAVPQAQAPGVQPSMGQAPSGAMPMGPAPVPVGPNAAAPGAVPPVDPLSPMGEGPVIPPSTKDVVTGLQGAKIVSLEDVTKAQDSLARLQLLLEIEEKLLQIEKVRNDRKKEASGGGIAGMIPAATLQMAPPPVVDQMPASSSRGAVKRYRPSDDEVDDPEMKAYKVDQITGVEGRYQALMSSEDGKVIPVRAGDKLPDGTMVRSVTLQGVMVKHGRKTELLSVQTSSRLITGVRSQD